MTSHEIPAEQRANVLGCPYLWISHGHPDHLSPASLELLRDKTILLPDHVGGRVARELGTQGFGVRVLQDGAWTELGPRTRVCSIADFQQDAILLVDLGGKLLVNTNDASDHGAGSFVRAEVAKRATSFLLCLTGYGDADMIHFFDEAGRFLPPPVMKHEPFLDGIEAVLGAFGVLLYFEGLPARRSRLARGPGLPLPGRLVGDGRVPPPDGRVLREAAPLLRGR